MSTTSAVLSALGLCVIGAILEGLAAGKNIKPLFARLRFPPYSPPLWAWYIVGALYYAICFTILYRLFRYNGDTRLWNISFVLILVILATNAIWNYLFFRAQSIFWASVLGCPYALVALILFVCLLQFDRIAAWALLPYLIYLLYAFRWSYSLWKLNP